MVEQVSSPWKHWTIRDIIPDSTISEINEAWPELKDHRWSTKKKKFSFKSHISDINDIPEPAASVLYWFNSQPFLEYLSKLTKIPSLLADPTLDGGGLHSIQRGGYLKTHVDFNRLPSTGWYRRLNLLVYLNQGWQTDWGGALSLYAKKEESDDWHRSPVVSYPPLAGLSVLFETNAYSFHGHPQPLSCPEGVTRRSLAIYYYTKEPPPKDGMNREKAHNTIYFINDAHKEYHKQ